MEDFIKRFLINDPESIFAADWLCYKSREIEDIINRFELANNARPMHGEVVALLRAARKFRVSTDPDGIFEEMRSQGKSDEQLLEIFTDMETAVANAQTFQQQKLTEQDKKITADALSYTKACVYNRIVALKSTDRLLPFWEKSGLKERLG